MRYILASVLVTVLFSSILIHAQDEQPVPTGICAGGGRPAGPCTSAENDNSSASAGSSSANSDDSGSNTTKQTDYSFPKPDRKRDSLAYLRYGLDEMQKLRSDGDSNDYEYRNVFDIFQHSVTENPKNCAAIFGEAHVLYLAGRYADALKAFQEVKRCGNRKQLREFWSGPAIDNIDEWLSTLARFKSSQYPCTSWNCKEEWTNEIWADARRFFKGKRYSEAELLYRREIAMHPDYPNPYRRLGDCLWFEERYWEAILAFRSAIDHSSDLEFNDDLLKIIQDTTIIAYEKDAKDFLTKGDFANAQDAINKAIKSSGFRAAIGGTIDIHELQSQLFIAKKDWQNARNVLESNPLAYDKEYPGGLDTALRKVYDGIYGSPTSINDEVSNLNNGDKALKAKDWRAAQFYFFSYAFSPEGARDVNAYSLLAYSFSFAGEFGDAEFVLALALKLFPSDSQLRSRLEEAHAKNQRAGTLKTYDEQVRKENQKFQALEDRVDALLRCPQASYGGNCNH